MTQMKYFLTFALMVFVLAGCGAEEAPVASTPLPAAPTPEEQVIETPPTTPVPPEEDEIVYSDALVDGAEVTISEPAGEQVEVVVSGHLGDPCTEIDDILQAREDNLFLITITTRRPAEAVCAQVLEPFEEVITLDVAGLEPGTYTVDVNGVQAIFTWPPDMVTPTTQAVVDAPESCVLTEPDRSPYFNLSGGYCLQYPNRFRVGDVYPVPAAPNVENIVAIYGPPLDESLEPLQAGLTITVEGPANGRSLPVYFNAPDVRVVLAIEVAGPAGDRSLDEIVDEAAGDQDNVTCAETVWNTVLESFTSALRSSSDVR